MNAVFPIHFPADSPRPKLNHLVLGLPAPLDKNYCHLVVEHPKGMKFKMRSLNVLHIRAAGLIHSVPTDPFGALRGLLTVLYNSPRAT